MVATLCDRPVTFSECRDRSHEKWRTISLQIGEKRLASTAYTKLAHIKMTTTGESQREGASRPAVDQHIVHIFSPPRSPASSQPPTEHGAY